MQEAPDGAQQSSGVVVPLEPLAVDVVSAGRMTSLGKMTLWQAIASGEPPSFTVSRRRLTLVEDLRTWLYTKAGRVSKGWEQ